jgi:hypothetical protein
MKRIPVRALQTVYHVGTLNLADKGSHFKGSYEGNALSISVTPNAWIAIAKLGGYPVHELVRQNSLFLDMRSLTKSNITKINEWGVKSGFLKIHPKWSISYYDDEIDETMSMDFDTEREALEELDQLDDDDQIPKLKSIYVLTEAGSERACGYPMNEDAWDINVMFWTEDVLRRQLPNIMGVWWNENYDPMALSAPRGAIFPSCVSEFHVCPASNLLDEDDMIEGLPLVKYQAITSTLFSSPQSV